MSRSYGLMLMMSLLYSEPALAINYIQAPAQGGSTTIIVNLQNGNITVCPAFNNANTHAPIGTCKQQGTISVAGVGGVASNMQITTPNNDNATITNLTNGAVMMCSLTLYGSNGVPAGTCVAGKAF